jgi:lysophospholipase L1-like esterase
MLGFIDAKPRQAERTAARSVSPRRAGATRAKRAVLWGVALFWAAQFGLTLLLDYVCPDIRFRTLVDTLAALRAHPRSPDILCLGSSRIGTAFREDIIAKEVARLTGDEDVSVFNAGVEGADLPTARLVFERILAEGTRPGLVVIEVSPETLAARNRWLRHDFIRQLTWGDVLTQGAELVRSGGATDVLKMRIIPVHYHRDRLRRELYQRARNAYTDWRDRRRGRDLPADIHTSGVAWDVYMKNKRDEPTPPAVRTEAGLPLVRKWVEHYQIGGGPAAALEALLRRCREEKIAVVLLGVPLSGPHRAFYTPEILTAYHGHVDRLCQEYGCRFVDYLDSMPDAAFQDDHHLMMEGAQEFSQRLAREAVAPAWGRGLVESRPGLRGTP